MTKYLLLALNGPTGGEGNEEALNRWYDEVHIPAFLRIPEVKSARRFKILHGKIPGRELWPYVTAYEIETNDLPALAARFQKELSNIHPALNRDDSANIMAVQMSEDA